MTYSLRTILIALTIGPPALAWFLDTPNTGYIVLGHMGATDKAWAGYNGKTYKKQCQCGEPYTSSANVWHDLRCNKCGKEWLVVADELDDGVRAYSISPSF